MADWQPIGKIPEFVESLAEEDTELAFHLKPAQPIVNNIKILTVEEKVIHN